MLRFETQVLDRRRPKDEREIHQRMRPLSRFQTPDEHQQFVDGLVREMRIRQRIEQLQDYRRHGIRTLAEAAQFDLEQLRSSQSSGAVDGTALSNSKCSRPNHLYDIAHSAKGTPDSIAAAAQCNGPDGTDALGDGTSRRSKRMAMSSDGPSLPATVDVFSAPLAEKLDQREIAFCTSAQLLPEHYLLLKDALLARCHQNSQNGALSRSEVLSSTASTAVPLDEQKHEMVCDFPAPMAPAVNTIHGASYRCPAPVTFLSSTSWKRCLSSV